MSEGSSTLYLMGPLFTVDTLVVTVQHKVNLEPWTLNINITETLVVQSKKLQSYTHMPNVAIICVALVENNVFPIVFQAKDELFWPINVANNIASAITVVL